VLDIEAGQTGAEESQDIIQRSQRLTNLRYLMLTSKVRPCITTPEFYSPMISLVGNQAYREYFGGV
jgi:hypothetical protein